MRFTGMEISLGTCLTDMQISLGTCLAGMQIRLVMCLTVMPPISISSALVPSLVGLMHTYYWLLGIVAFRIISDLARCNA